MRSICTSIVATLMLAGTTFAQDAVEWRVEDGGNGHWYQGINPGPTTWADSRSSALDLGGDLTSMETDDEIIWVFNTIASNPSLWYYNAAENDGPYIGGFQDTNAPDYDEPAGGWYWLTGTPLQTNYWGPGQPNYASQDHLHFWSPDASVSMTFDNVEDTDDGGGSSYIVEWSADCNDDGIVDYGQIRDGTYADDDGNGVPDCCDDATCLAPVQWKIENGGNGHWYVLDTYHHCSHEEAQAAAEAAGGHLVTITSMGEDDFIDGIIDETGPHTTDIHAGGRYADGVWSWETGEDWGFEDWGPNLPTGEALWMEIIGREDQPKFYLHWGDVEDGYCQYALIEWSADCNGDGVVDYGQILDGTYADDDGNGVPDCCDMGIPCATEWALEDGGNGHWYEEVLEPGISWGNASDSCISVGGHLATVTSAEENLFIAGISNANEQGDYGIWLGGFQDETSPDYSEPGGGWTWVTNEPWSYESWNQNDCHPSNQPDNANQAESVLDYFCGSADALYWSDDGPEWPNSSGYLIEWSADCNGDGVVDYGQILDGTYNDADGNGVPDCCEDTSCLCPADVTGDGTVDITDLLIVIGAWNSDYADADIDGNGVVSIHDLLAVIDSWGPCP